MIRFFCTKKLLLGVKHRTSLPTVCNGYLYTTKSSRETISDPEKYLTVSYPQNSCGFSLESATSASKKRKIDEVQNPDSVLKLLRSYGLNETHIKKLITARPAVLLADFENTLKSNLEVFVSLGFSGTNLGKLFVKYPRVLGCDAKETVEFLREYGFSNEQIASFTLKRPTLYLHNAHENLKPKFEFLKSLGFSPVDVAKRLSMQPFILQSSLENRIIPAVRVLRRILGSDENVVKALGACFMIAERRDLDKVLEANITLLLDRGVPKDLVLRMFMQRPKYLLLKTDRLNEVVTEVEKLGLHPSNMIFLLAVRTLGLTNKELWKKRVEAYQSFGMSKDEIYLAFKMQPQFMEVSDEKIQKLMSFYLYKLKLRPSDISKQPKLMLLSLDKRIMPRCAVLQILLSKDLIKRDIKPYILAMTEKKFLENILSKYQDVAPEVVLAHQGKVQFHGFPEDVKIGFM
ncbi:hypothetical protein Tsubulata_021071 [Turnera subulata]|uniref:Uncharacterized protein n=1 Tax=Turnera subulata TaxID=218843 RepID=A0A9Q0FY54_9ROSI|nr:hypothetical protein Tsubulata_021071 [Turnera subulata]